jgi:hypothetical protein
MGMGKMAQVRTVEYLSRYSDFWPGVKQMLRCYSRQVKA